MAVVAGGAHHHGAVVVRVLDGLGQHRRGEPTTEAHVDDLGAVIADQRMASAMPLTRARAVRRQHLHRAMLLARKATPATPTPLAWSTDAQGGPAHVRAVTMIVLASSVLLTKLQRHDLGARQVGTLATPVSMTATMTPSP